MRDHEDQIREAGVGLAAIGTGDLHYARAFERERGIDFPLLVDDDLESYRAIGAGRLTVGRMLSPSSVAANLRLLARGRRQGRTGRHPLTLGATHVIRPDGSVPYAWINASLPDEPPLGEVLAALGARSGGAGA